MHDELIKFFDQFLAFTHSAVPPRWMRIKKRNSLLTLMRNWHKSDSSEGIVHVIHHRGKPVDSIKKAWASILKKPVLTRS